MKRVVAGLSALGLFVAAPASAGTVGGSILNTIDNAAANDGRSQAERDTIRSTVSSYITSLFGGSGACASSNSWLCAALAWAVPQGTSLTRPTPTGRTQMWDGAGASGSWEVDDPCEDWAWNLDADGNLIVPSIPLGGGGELVNVFDDPRASGWVSLGWTNSSTTYSAIADGPGPMALWYIHGFNMHNRVAGYDHPSWVGYWGARCGIGSSGKDCEFYGGSQAYFNTAGIKVGRMEQYVEVKFANNRMGNEPQSCPNMSTGGGDFDFYYNWGGDMCTMYAPNSSLSKSGYAYPTKASIPSWQWQNWPNALTPDFYMVCPLSRPFLQQLANAAWAAASPSTYSPVAENEVTDDGAGPPTVEDLKDETIPPAAPGEPVPDATPTPTPTPDAPDYNPNVTNPDPVAPDIDWWPDLPSIDVDLGSPACPTYSLTLPQWSEPFVLNSHCPLVEQYRSAIAVLMVAMFTMMGFFIVLRA